VFKFNLASNKLDCRYDTVFDTQNNVHF